MSDLVLRFRVVNDGQALSVLRGVRSAAEQAGKAFDRSGRSGRTSAKAIGEAWSQAGRPLRATEKLAQQVARDQERAARQAANAQIREGERAHKALVRQHVQRERMEQRHAHQRELRERRFAARIDRARQIGRADSFAMMTRGASAVGSRMTSAISSAGSLALAGGAALTGAALRQQVHLSDSARKLARKGGGGVTGAELLADAESLAGQVQGAKASGILGAQDAFVTKTGDLDAARRFSKVFAEISLATGTAADEIGSAAADMFQKFDIKTIQQMESAMATLAVQGKRGSFELEDAARLFPRVLASAKRFGVEANAEGLATVGGLVQLSARDAGGAENAATALENVFAELAKKSNTISKSKARGGLGVDIFDKSNQGRPIVDVLTEVIGATGGDQGQLNSLFGARGIRAVSPLISTFNKARIGASGSEEERTAAGIQAMRDEIARATDATGALAEIQSDLASAQQDASSQLAATWEKLRSQIGAELLPVVAKFITKLAATDFAPLIKASSMAANGLLNILKVTGFANETATSSSQFALTAADKGIAAQKAREEAAAIENAALYRKATGGADITPEEQARVKELGIVAQQYDAQRAQSKRQQASAERFDVPINEADAQRRAAMTNQGGLLEQDRAQAGGLQASLNQIVSGLQGVEGLSAADKAALKASQKLTVMGEAVNQINAALAQMATELREAGGAARALKESEGS